MNAAQTLVYSWLSAPKRYPPIMMAMGYDPFDYKFPFALRGTPRKMHMDVTRGKRKRIGYLNHCARVNREQSERLTDPQDVLRRDFLIDRASALEARAEAMSRK